MQNKPWFERSTIVAARIPAVELWDQISQEGPQEEEGRCVFNDLLLKGAVDIFLLASQ